MNLSKLTLLLIGTLLLLQPGPGVAQDAKAAKPQVEAKKANKKAKKVALIAFGNPESPMDIGPYSESYLERKLEVAKKLGADVVVLEMDSPGGYIDEGLSMAGTLRDLSWAKTVAYVPRQSLSAGSFICLA